MKIHLNMKVTVGPRRLKVRTPMTKCEKVRSCRQKRLKKVCRSMGAQREKLMSLQPEPPSPNIVTIGPLYAETMLSMHTLGSSLDPWS